MYFFIFAVSALNLLSSANIFITFVNKNENEYKNACIPERIMLGYPLIRNYKKVHLFIVPYLNYCIIKMYPRKWTPAKGKFT